MKSRYPISLLVIGFFAFSVTSGAWSQDCCKRVYRPPIKASCGYDSCKPCCSNPVIELLKGIDCALQGLLPCRRSCCKTTFGAKPMQKSKAPSCGCGVPAAPGPMVPAPDPFMDDEVELRAPPVPAIEAKHTPYESKVARRASHSAPLRASSNSPQRFKPMNASPLSKALVGQKPVVNKDATTAAEDEVEKAKRPLFKSVRLAEFVLP